MRLEFPLLALAVTAACGDVSPSVPRGEGTFGPMGGRLTSDDGLAELEIPEGTFPAETKVVLHAEPVGDLGFEGQRMWRLSFGLAAPQRALRLSMPCEGEACAGDERLGRRGQAGLLPEVAGTDLAEKTLRARVTQAGDYGVTRCAHMYCLSATLEGASLRLEHKALAGAAVTVTPTPGEPIRPDEVSRRYDLSGPDGTDSLVAVLDPLAPPSGLAALSTPTGAVRVVWEPSVFPGAQIAVERQFCSRLERLEVDGRAGLWDAALSPGSWYVYQVSALGGKPGFAQLQPDGPEEGCAVRPYACELPMPLGGAGAMSLEVMPALSEGRYVLKVADLTGSLDGFADQVSFGPATTRSESSIEIEGDREAQGERLVWVEATRPDSGATCLAPVWVRAIEETSRVYVAVYGGYAYTTPQAIQVRSGEREWETPIGSAGYYRFNALIRDGGQYEVAVTCKPGVSRVITATVEESRHVRVQCPAAASVSFPVTFSQPLTTSCQRVVVGPGAPSACATEAPLTLSAPVGSVGYIASWQDAPDGPVVRFQSSWLAISESFAGFQVYSDWSQPTVPKTARIVGGAPDASGVVFLLTGNTRMPFGRGGSEFTFGAVNVFSGDMRFEVTSGNERMITSFDGEVDVTADLTAPFPAADVEIAGGRLSGTVEAGIEAILVEAPGARWVVSPAALARGPVALAAANIGLAAPSTATVTAYATNVTGLVEDVVVFADGEGWLSSGTWVRSRRLP